MLQGGLADIPLHSSLPWCPTPPSFHQAEAFYGKIYKNVGFSIAVNGYSTTFYNQGEHEVLGRLSVAFYFRPEKMKDLKAGFSTNIQFQKTANFIIWESDSFAYTPSGGADTSLEELMLTYQNGIRFNIDLYVKYVDKNRNLHVLKTRYYLVKNDNITNKGQSSTSAVSYADYQFQKKWGAKTVLTSGFTYIRNDVASTLFDNHFSNNAALYSQIEYSLDKLDLTGGVRMEYFDQDGIQGDSELRLGQDSASTTLPVYPIARL